MKQILKHFRDTTRSNIFDSLKVINWTRAEDDDLSRIKFGKIVESKEESKIEGSIKLNNEYFLLIEAGISAIQPEYQLLAIPFIPNLDNHYELGFRPNILSSLEISPSLIETEDEDPTPVTLIDSSLLITNLSKLTGVNTDNWSVYLEYSIDSFTEVIGKSLEEIRGRIQKESKGDVHLFSSVAYATNLDNKALTNIYNLYNYALGIDQEELAKTSFSSLSQVYLNPEKEENHTEELFNRLETKSNYLVGHIDSTQNEEDYQKDQHLKNRKSENIFNKDSYPKGRELFPLDNTQRQVNAAISKIKDTESVAVNGPPGSGKTAMLKAVIASKWVRAAIDKEDCPITIAVGATNQSVTNVIEAFPESIYTGDEEDLLLFKRWVGNFRSYGTYFPSKSKLNDPNSKTIIENNVVAQPSYKNYPQVFNWINEEEKFSNPSNYETIKSDYLANIQKFYQTNTQLLEDLFSHPNIKNKRSSILNKGKELFRRSKNNSNFEKECEFNNIDEGIEFLNKCLKLLEDSLIHAAQSLKSSCNERNIKALETKITGYLSKSFCNKQTLETLSSLLEINKKSSSTKIAILNEICREKILDEGLELEKDAKAVEKIVPYASTILIEHFLDITYRRYMFHFAARYWEAFYIKECSKRLLIAKTSKNVREGLRRMCMLTPVLVSTIHNIASLFKYRGSVMGQSNFLIGEADHLIMDETGQAPISLALPVTILAKKLIAVGDTEQLKPVITDAMSLDEEKISLVSNGFSEQEALKFHDRSILNIKGSMLHLVKCASRYTTRGKGILLRGHYRCATPIIRYSNNLIYEKALFYAPFLKKKEAERNKEDFDSHPICYIPSLTDSSSPDTGSKVNPVEATKIIEFLIESLSLFLSRYTENGKSKKIYDIVAIVTPFRKQSEVIKSKLLENRENFSPLIEDLSDLDKIIIGTVDALQGAEKQIVLFSGVHAKNESDKPYFADEPFLLNVALSRAKDRFIAFICPEVYGLNNLVDDKENTEPQKEGMNSVEYLGHYLLHNGFKLRPRNLVIIEAPGKLNALSSILGSNYDLIATRGSLHTLGLEKSSLRTKDGLIPKYELKEGAEDIIDTIISKGSGADNIFIATDDDYVGETIAWHVVNQVKLKNDKLASKFKRVRLRAITNESVNESFNNPTTIDEKRVSAEVTREIIDTLVARKLYLSINQNRHLGGDKILEDLKQYALDKSLIQKNLKKSSKINIGRVKAGVLDLLYKKLVHQHNCRELPNVKVKLQVNNNEYVGKVKCRDLNKLKLVKNGPVKKDHWKIEKSKRTSMILPPTLSTLGILEQAWIKYRIKPSDAMDSLQNLYTGDYK